MVFYDMQQLVIGAWKEKSSYFETIRLDKEGKLCVCNEDKKAKYSFITVTDLLQKISTVGGSNHIAIYFSQPIKF